MNYNPLPFGSYGLGIATMVIAIMLAASGIILGIGYAVDDKRLKEFGRNEIYQSVINGALVGGLLLLFAGNGIITGIINDLTLANGAGFSCMGFMAGNSALCFAYNYLAGPNAYTFMGQSHNSLLTIISGVLIALLALAMLLGFVAGIKVDLLIATFSFSSVFSPFLTELQHIITITAASLVSVEVQAALLMFIAVTALTVILPLGLILRSFYLTRRTGGLFIAMALGLYVVLPLAYLLNAFLVGSYSTSFNQSSISSVMASAQSFGSALGAVPSSNTTNSSVAEGIIGYISSGISSLTNSLGNMLKPLLYFAAGLIMQAFILPTFSIVITFVFVREMARALGSEAFFGNWLRMV